MEWISLKDELPPTGQFVLVYNGSFYIKMYKSIFYDGDTHCYCPVGEIQNVTHWMPLPEPPLDYSEYLNKYFKFPLSNQIGWSQDFCCYLSHIPHDVEFQLTSIKEEQGTLRAYGYGLIGIDECSYGAGAIGIIIKDIIPFMIDKDNTNEN